MLPFCDGRSRCDRLVDWFIPQMRCWSAQRILIPPHRLLQIDWRPPWRRSAVHHFSAQRD
jgi:hypothetical protein